MEEGVLHHLRGYRLGLLAGLVALAALIVGLVLRGMGPAAAANDDRPGAATGLGQLSGLLPQKNLVLESALQVDLTRETVRLPIYKGTANGHTVWFILTESSDQGLAKNSGLNYAPKLANIANGCPDCVQTVTQEQPTADQNKFGQAVIHYQGEPDFSPTRSLVPGPNGFPPASFSPGAVAGKGYSPFIRIEGTSVVYNAPIVATGNGPFDVVHHTNTADRVLGIHIAPPAPAGQYFDSWVDLLLVKGFDAGQPILYLSTEADDPLASVLERSTYVPALARASPRPADRPRWRPLRHRRYRHQLRSDRLYRRRADRQPRSARPELSVPAPLVVQINTRPADHLLPALVRGSFFTWPQPFKVR